MQIISNFYKKWVLVEIELNAREYRVNSVGKYKWKESVAEAVRCDVVSHGGVTDVIQHGRPVTSSRRNYKLIQVLN